MKKIIILLTFFMLFILNVKASYVVMDMNNVSVLDGNSIHEKRLIASITKVMTAHIVINNINDLDEYIVVGDEINDAYGSSIYLKKDEKIKVIDLLYGLLLRSGNDAAVVLAKHIGGSVDNFVKMMNEEAQNLKMFDTSFSNPSGLDDDSTQNISSAYDMALLTKAAMKNDVFRQIFKTKHHKVKTNLNVHDWYNKNKALSMYKYVTGGKTGYTKKAHRTLITTASKDNMNLVIVSLNMNDDFNFHVNKYKNIFNLYNNYLIINKSNLSVNDKYYQMKGCFVTVNNNYRLTIRKDQVKNLSLNYELIKDIKLYTNNIAGTLYIYNKNKVIYEEPLYLVCKSKVF